MRFASVRTGYKMKYNSTRGEKAGISSAEAIKKGMAGDGGLYMPESIPNLTLDELKSLCSLSYAERAAEILSKFLTDYDRSAIDEICAKAYSESKFGKNAAPCVSLGDSMNILELWHGPTCAFKDMALQIMPLLLSKALEMTGEKRTACILVATSGDTGKAALEGYKDVDKTKIMVFYPENGVSIMQKRQMATQEGGNVNVASIKGNFDDAQSAVKSIFANRELADEIKASTFLSSANSINWGRLAPQIAYYVSAYCDMAVSGRIELGDKINVCVPTGNFGNIFAAYIARTMGLPINKLICASNTNNILTDFLADGVYDRNRRFYTTMSPSMDILISSNLERLLFVLCGPEETREYMQALKQDGKYSISAKAKAEIDRAFAGGWCSEDETGATIKDIFEEYHYLCDTHTAVAVKTAKDYMSKTADGLQMLIASTASPYKFAGNVYAALTGVHPEDEFEAIDLLSDYSGTAVPAGLAGLRDKTVRFTTVLERDDMERAVKEFIGK